MLSQVTILSQVVTKTPPRTPILSARFARFSQTKDVEAAEPEPAPPARFSQTEANAPPKPEAHLLDAHGHFVTLPNCPWVNHWAAAFTGSFLGLGGLFVIENELRAVHFLPDPMLSVGSFAAVATLMYAAPAAPLGKPWNMFYGHFLSIALTMVVWHTCEAMGWSPDLAVALSPSLSIGLMVQQKVPHPPAAAISWIFASSLRAHAQVCNIYMFIIIYTIYS
jgi:hypothetical protein